MDRYKATFEAWDRMAKAYEDKFMDLDLYNDTLDHFCDSLENIDPKILEVGCGPGNISRYILSKLPGSHLTGIDISPNMIGLARKNNPAATFEVMDGRYMTLPGKFDAIISGFCIPYLSKPDLDKFLGDCASILLTGGRIYISAIAGRYENSGLQTGSTGDSTYVYYYEKNELQEMLEKNGFSQVKCTEKIYKVDSNKNSVHLVMMAKLA